MAEELKAEIQAQGEEVRSLKAAGEDASAAVAELLSLKDKYKALTGKGYAAAPSKEIAKAKPSEAAKSDGQAAKEGPSKGELKKAAKKAEKSAKKAATKANSSAPESVSGDTTAIPAPAAAAAAASAKVATQPAMATATAAGVATASGAVRLHAGAAGPALFKCLAASQLCGVPVSPAVGGQPPHDLPADVSVVAGPGIDDAVIFGANAVCRYLSYRAAASAAAATLQLDELIEWEERVLAPAASQPDPSAALALLEEKLIATNTGGFLLASGPSLADAVVGGGVAAAVAAAAGSGGAAPVPPAVQAYWSRLSAEPWFSRAQEALAGVELAAAGAADESNADSGLLATLTALFSAAIVAAFPAAADLGLGRAVVFKCANPAHGDFQCNSAMALHKALRIAGVPGAPAKPMDVAATVRAHLPESAIIEEATLAGAGYINVRLRPAYLSARIAALVRDGARPPPTKRLKVAVDFSSPNIAKEMHVGHLRSTIIGDTLCRIFEFCGHEVLRINHVGDWGTQFGMLINYMEEIGTDTAAWEQHAEGSGGAAGGGGGTSGSGGCSTGGREGAAAVAGGESESDGAAGGGGGAGGAAPSITDLTGFYKAAKKRFDESEDFKERSRQTVVRLQAGDPDCRRVWEMLCTISRAEFQKVYDRLNIRLTEVGESFYNPLIPAAIAALEERGLVTLDAGAHIVSLPHFTYPLIVRKGDGGYGYDSTDMAAVRYRLQELECDRIVYVTDEGQSSHFHMVFDAARAAGWLGEAEAARVGAEGGGKGGGGGGEGGSGNRLEHVGFGVVKGEDGKKFKTRSGETVRLVDLLDEAVARANASLQERVAEKKSSLSPEDIPRVAAAIGYGAVKYFDLRQHPATPYVFSYDRMLDTRGNTAVYLLFAHARLASILRKAQDEFGVVIAVLKAGCNGCDGSNGDNGGNAGTAASIEHPSERALAFALLQFPEVVSATVASLLPHGICDYLYDLAAHFTDFVTNCHVLGSEPALRDGRLLLCEATRVVMRQCLELLGIEPMDRI